MVGNLEEAQKMSKANIEAASNALGVWSKAAQSIAVEMADHSKRSYENTTKAIEKLFAARSVDKAIEVQTEYAKSMFEDYSAQVTKLNQLYADLTKESFKPFESQIGKMSASK